MTTKPDGGLAFPQPIAVGPDGVAFPGHYGPNAGMSLRDWLAGQAIAGAVNASAETLGLFASLAEKQGRESPEIVASLAYELADAMIAERGK
jgi:hypothetical protein